jgi:hypothetical protein
MVYSNWLGKYVPSGAGLAFSGLFFPRLSAASNTHLSATTASHTDTRLPTWPVLL